MLRRVVLCVVAGLVASAGMTPADMHVIRGGAASGASQSVADLARQGHWTSDGEAEHRRMIGRPAPALELTEWVNGEVTRASWKNRIVVVDFWATWCGPCLRSIPHNNELVRRYGRRGVLFIGACGGGRRGGQDSMATVAKQCGLTYPTAKVSSSDVKAWNVFYWPTYVIIDRTGTVRAAGVKASYVEPIITALLNEAR